MKQENPQELKYMTDCDMPPVIYLFKTEKMTVNE